MFVEHTHEQKSLREELRAYFGSLMTPEVRAGLIDLDGGPGFRDLVARMGADGWLGVGWPVTYGGQGRTLIEQLIWFEEARRAGVPLPYVTLNTVGPTLMEHGTDAQKQRFLPGILAGEIHFAIGYTESEAGTDLASLSTRAIRQGDEYVVNGSKIFTSGASHADYIWLACRTDPDAPKHRGISILIVDTRSSGFSHSPIEIFGGGRTSMTYYENVHVPVEMLVGPENGGWKLMTLQLNHERIMLAAFASAGFQLFEEVRNWALTTTDEDDRPVGDAGWVRRALAECRARLMALEVMNWRLAWELEQRRIDPAQASAAKVYSSETMIEVYRLLLEVVGVAGSIDKSSPGALLEGRLEWEYRHAQINTFGGGVNEIQRELVAMLGLGMPRVPR
jgi:alkylation response protein AidB-like acyl-CoA dehydrogenase